jgi:hypothetical protein
VVTQQGAICGTFWAINVESLRSHLMPIERVQRLASDGAAYAPIEAVIGIIARSFTGSSFNPHTAVFRRLMAAHAGGWVWW